MNKKEQKRFDNLTRNLKLSTFAEKQVLTHLLRRDKNDILIYRIDSIEERIGFVFIKVVTNKHSLSFGALAERLNKGDETELYQKIA